MKKKKNSLVFSSDKYIEELSKRKIVKLVCKRCDGRFEGIKINYCPFCKKRYE